MIDLGGDLRVIERFIPKGIHALGGPNDIFLSCVGEALRTTDIMHRISRRLKLNPLKTAGKKTIIPLTRRDRLPLTSARGREDDKAGEILRFTPQAVGEP